MKTISLTNACRSLAIVIPLIMSMHVSASDYQTFYVADINNEATTMYCSGTDSLRFIPPAGADVYAWFLNGHADTLYVDTLIIPNGYEGMVACQGNFDSRYSHFFPLRTETSGNIEIICGGTGILGVSINTNDVQSYKWSPSTGLNDDAIRQPEAEVTEETTYYVTITTENGCEENDSMTISVNPLTVNAGEDKSLVCGGSVQFDQPVSNYTGSGSLTYSWLPSEGLNDAASPSPIAEITEAQTYSLSISTPNGCIAENSILVTINPLTAKVEHTDVYCGTETQLSALSNYTGSESLSYSWSPTGGLSASNIANPKVTLIGNMSYSVEIETHNGCVATASADLEPSVVNFNASICVVSVDENDYNIVVWSRSDNTAIESFNVYRESSRLAGSYDLVGVVPRTEPGVFIDSTSDASVQSNMYKIAAKDICGFVTGMSAEHKTMHLTVNKGFGNTWNLIWEPYEGISVSNYKIYRGSKISDMAEIGVTSGSNTTYTDENVTGTHAYYQIEMTLPFICNNLKSTQYSSSRSNIISTGDITGIINQKEESVQVFPNPLVDVATVRFSNPRNETYQLVLFDLAGKIMMVKDGISGDQIMVERNGIPAGLYMLELRGPKNYRTKILISL